MKKKTKKMKKKLKKFIKSHNAVILALSLMIVILLMLTYHLMNASKTYMFSGSNDNLKIYNGIISLNYDVNLFQGSDIEYAREEDEVVVDYKIGYYLDSDNKLIPVAIKSGADSKGLSLKAIIHEISAYNITEPYQNKTIFNKEKVHALEENGLYFILEATTIDGTELLEKLELNLTKVSK